ncbi:MAG: TIGR04283 family arsenosugar biosynthesis glycosyltransferase [Gammaproteobacteria bacterium]
MQPMNNAAPWLSIIIPTLNEAAAIGSTLIGLQGLRAAGQEVIVVDGGSTDATCRLAAPLVDQLVQGERGRARQMNLGAAAACGDVLLFLHADTRLAQDAETVIHSGLAQTGARWGRFDVRLSGSHPLLRVVETLMNLRSRLTGIATGDQAIFVRRDLFEQAGGFPDIPLMEDIALSRILKRFSRPFCARERVITSSRRWEQHGIVRTIFLMWRLRLDYALGVKPEQLVRRYYSSP